MNNLNKFKILIVGLTTVLALESFNKNDFRKGLVHVYDQSTKMISGENFYL